MVAYLLLSAIGGGGLAVAIVNVWGKIKVKQMDVFVEQRQQFIREVNELRNSMNELYNQQFALMQENRELKLKVKDLEDHVNKKSLLLNEISKYRGYFDQLRDIVKDFNDCDKDAFIKNVITLSECT